MSHEPAQRDQARPRMKNDQASQLNITVAQTTVDYEATELEWWFMRTGDLTSDLTGDLTVYQPILEREEIG